MIQSDGRKNYYSRKSKEIYLKRNNKLILIVNYCEYIYYFFFIDEVQLKENIVKDANLMINRMNTEISYNSFIKSKGYSTSY